MEVVTRFSTLLPLKNLSRSSNTTRAMPSLTRRPLPAICGVTIAPGMVRKRISGGKRFLRIGHVEGTAQPSALHFGPESVQVDQATTGNVDDTGAVRKVRQILPTQQALGLFGQAAVRTSK